MHADAFGAAAHRYQRDDMLPGSCGGVSRKPRRKGAAKARNGKNAKQYDKHRRTRPDAGFASSCFRRFVVVFRSRVNDRVGGPLLDIPQPRTCDLKPYGLKP